MTFLWILLGVVVILVLWIIGVFNALVKKINRVKNAWSDIDVQLKRRYDLVPNLVATVKGYKDYEASVLEDITEARARAMNDNGIASRAKAEDELSSAIQKFLALAEDYPDLKASENFRNLQEQLANLENDIQSARRYYNAAVREFNNAIQIFPASLVAKMFNFKPKEFFGAEVGEKDTVAVTF
ncbi:MAG TPA: LemA family protein [bacterium]|jgi:LemA protein|nr:LemA family protein [bacterium]